MAKTKSTSRGDESKTNLGIFVVVFLTVILSSVFLIIFLLLFLVFAGGPFGAAFFLTENSNSLKTFAIFAILIFPVLFLTLKLVKIVKKLLHG